MICFNCKRKIIGNGIVINIDGDFVCNEKCKEEYKKEMDHFFNVIVNNEGLFKDWMRNKIK